MEPNNKNVQMGGRIRSNNKNLPNIKLISVRFKWYTAYSRTGYRFVIDKKVMTILK